VLNLRNNPLDLPMNYANNIVVTGGAGFIGSNFVLDE
jgi:hypothetical protein